MRFSIIILYISATTRLYGLDCLDEGRMIGYRSTYEPQQTPIHFGPTLVYS